MMRPDQNFVAKMPVMKPEAVALAPPMRRVYRPAGKLIACQWVRGPERLDIGEVNLQFPDNVQVQNTGVKHLTAIMRVIAVGPDARNCKDDDLVLVSTDVTVFPINFAGQEMICLHDEAIFGVIAPEEEGELRSLMR